MIQQTDGNMVDSMANVFVYILPVDGAFYSDIPLALHSKANEIVQSIGQKKRLGRLWIYPFKMKWPDGLQCTPNGEPSRTVWGALIPQQEKGYEYHVGQSLHLLKRWIAATGLPLRIAIMGNERYYQSGSRNCLSHILKREIEISLKDWDVEIYMK